MKIKLMPMLAGVIALSVVATPLILNAQPNTSDQPAQSNRRHHGMWEQLNLSPEQQEQIRQIREETRAQKQAILTPEQQEQLNAAGQNGQGRNRQEWRSIMASLTDDQKAAMRELKEQEKARIEEILTPEQQQQLEQMRQQWQQRRQERGIR